MGLLVVHLAEGLMFVRRHALVFVTAKRKKAYRANLGSGGTGFVWVGALPPFAEGFVTSTWPVAIGETALWTQPAQVIGRLRPELGRKIDFDSLAKVRAEGPTVVAGKIEIARVSGPVGAAVLAEQIERLRTAGERRPRVFREIMKDRLDVKRARDLLIAFNQASQSLTLFAVLQFLLIGIGAPAFFKVPAFFTWWPYWLGAVALTHLTLGVLFWRAHKRLYPKALGDRLVRIAIMLINPLAGLRVTLWLGRAVWADVHPLAAAQLHLRQEPFQEIFEEVVRDLVHAPPADGEEQEVLQTHRQVLTKLTREFAKKHKLDFEAAAVGHIEEAERYCPRCLQTYMASSQACEDCQGLLLVSAEKTSLGGAPEDSKLSSPTSP